jgi:transcription initiation factor TFIID/TFIIF subunit
LIELLHVTDILHLTTAFTTPPYLCSNEGWGEFDITIDLYTTEKTKLSPIVQDLNFAQEHYSVLHPVTFKNPSQALQERLRETGPLPNDEDRSKKKSLGSKKSSQKYDYEKVAEALQKLEEEDLLKVIQMINEGKGPETYIRSDIEGKSTPHALDETFRLMKGELIVDNLLEAGEFSIDLYTMPDSLTTKLWEFFVSTFLCAIRRVFQQLVQVPTVRANDCRSIEDQEGIGYLGR